MSLIEHRDILIDLAQSSIKHGLDSQSLRVVRRDDYPAILHDKGASFVTLTIKEQLRGCIGSLEARRPLFEDVNYNAYAAAFSDPRFKPLVTAEFDLLHISISILSKPEPMQFTSEQDLLAQLKPEVDGLIIQLGHHNATFLPAVWKQISDPQQFLNQLKRKAQLSVNYWAQDIKVWRYTTQSIS